MIKFIELFAGIGGFRYGLEKANDTITERTQQGIQQGSRNNPTTIKSFLGTKQFTCVYANEIDKYACQIYRKNFGEGELYEGDIRKVTAKSIPDFTFLTAGFPCQAFSVAGKRRGFNDTRGTLFFEICRILNVKRPPYFLLENVGGLLNHNKGETFGTILYSLDKLGYDIQWQVCNSKNFGIPQSRERVFFVGNIRGKPRPKVFPITSQIGLFKKPYQEFKYYNKCGKAITPDGISGTLLKSYGALSGESTKIIEKKGIRIFTPTECERLQGFPDGWTEGISDTQRYKCLGNAVTTNVITEIGRKIIECI